MALVGYARVSTIDQNLDIQLDALKNAGCKKIFSEKKSGTSKKDRTALDECMDYIREGDTLVVTRIDRLTRSILDLQNLLHYLKEKEIHLKALEQPVDTSNASGKFFWICSVSLLSLKPIFVVNGNWKVSNGQSRKASTKDESLQLVPNLLR
nr:recombinase family protein [Legionella tunisiensis]